MRDDIAKKLCERPRVRGDDKVGTRSDRRTTKYEKDWDSLPKKEGMRKKHVQDHGGKEFNENFAPLLRFLQKNVGRPWNKVFSEISAHLNPTSTTHKHVFDHLIDGFVTVKPTFVGKIPYYVGYNFSEVRGLYVDSHGLLKDNDTPRDRARREKAQAKRQAKRKEDLRKPINDLEAYCRFDGIWYHVWYKNVLHGEECHDVISSSPLGRDHGVALRDGTWDPSRRRVAVAKKQVSSKEIRDERLGKS